MRFNKLDMNLLVVLDALLATQSVGKAAERLFLSQPATSLALGRLREFFQDELLVSVGKAMVPTPLAAELAAPVREVLVQVQTISRARPTFDPGATAHDANIVHPQSLEPSRREQGRIGIAARNFRQPRRDIAAQEHRFEIRADPLHLRRAARAARPEPCALRQIGD